MSTPKYDHPPATQEAVYAYPALAEPVMSAQSQQGRPSSNGAPQVVYVQQQVPADPRLAMRGIRPGGMYTRETYCGVVSILIGVFLLPCICCCPVDSQEVYIEPGTGRRVVLSSGI